MKKKDESIWQVFVSNVRNKYKDRLETWFNRLDVLISEAQAGKKIDKNEIEALKLGFRFFDALKEEKSGLIERAKTDKVKQGDLSESEKSYLEKILNGKI